MITIAPLDELMALEQINTCAADPSLWPQALKQLETSCTALACLLEFDAGEKHTAQYCPDDIARDLIDYLDVSADSAGESALSILLKHTPLLSPACKFVITGRSVDLIDDSLPLEKRTIREWPGLITPVFRNDERTILFACLWPSVSAQEIKPENVLPTFQRLSKALASSLTASLQLQHASTQLLAIQDFMGAQGKASCLMDHNGVIHYQTPAFTHTLNDAELFVVENRKLQAVNREIADLLSGLYSTLYRQIKSQTERQQSVSQFLSRKQNDTAGSLLNLVLTRLYLSGYANPYYMLEIRQPLEVSQTVKEVLQTRFGLSKSELKLAYDLALSDALSETQQRLGISRNTAKTHMRHIYEKTGTRSQLEFSRLVHQLASLL